MNKRPTYKKASKNTGFVLGTAGLGGVWSDVDQGESVETILYALENGIMRLDTAPAYMDAEEIIGTTLEQWNGKRPFISTKVGKLKGKADGEGLNDYGIGTMAQSISQSLERLHCDRLDLLFLHEPEKVPEHQVETVVEFLKEQKKNGKTSQIGLGGYVPLNFRKHLAYFDVVMSFNNLDVCNFSGMEFDIPFFRNKGLITYQGSALHMGLLGNRFEKYQKDPPSWLDTESIENAKTAHKIASKYRIKLSTLAHRFLLSVAEVDFLVIGARNSEQLKMTLNDCKYGALPKRVFKQLIEQIVP